LVARVHTDADTAIRVARELEQLNIFWLEEPFLPDEFEAYARLADTVDIKVAAYAREQGKGCVPHAWKSGIVKAASLHIDAVLPEAWFQECCVAETPLNTRLTRQVFPLTSDGFVEVPTEPGLGVDLDPEVLEQYAVGDRPISVTA
jgi:L-alanine-DL-glutamate epimerase-like enolase superfamily enzyme